MRKWLIRRPSPAMVVAMLALLVAMGGTVYAAGTINGTQIKKNSVPGNRIKKASLPGNRLKQNTVTGTQINESTLGQVPSAVTANTANTANPAAYAHILANGSVDGSDALNITSANVTHPHEGIYCLTGLSFKAHAVMATVDSGDGPGATETSVIPANFHQCPSSANAEIVTFVFEPPFVKDYEEGLYVVVF